MSAKRGTPQAWIEHAETELAHAREPKGDALAVECFSAHQAAHVLSFPSAAWECVPAKHRFASLIYPPDSGFASPDWIRQAALGNDRSAPVSAEEHAEAVRVAAAVLEWAKAEVARGESK